MDGQDDKPNGWEERANRFLTGETGRPVTVRVEMVQNTPEVVVEHNLNNLSDFSRLDFFMPLGILFVIYLFNFLAFSRFIVMFLQIVLVLDLFKRVRRRPSGKRVAGFINPYAKAGYGWALAAYVVCSPFILGAIWFNRWLIELLFPGYAQQDIANVQAAMVIPAWYMAIMIISLILNSVFFAPITEETWFRGIGLAGFLRKNNSPVRAVLWTSILFGLLHGPSRMLFTTLLGLLFSLIRFRTGSIYCCMAVHGLHNLLAVIYGLAITIPTL